jgi:hypothetical protein
MLPLEILPWRPIVRVLCKFSFSYRLLRKCGYSCLFFISLELGVLQSVFSFYFLPISKCKLDGKLSTCEKGKITYREATLSFISREINLFPV